MGTSLTTERGGRIASILMLDLHRLRALLAVREHGGFLAAARALSLSPAEVADLVGGLERQVGLPLVDGEPRGTRLTPAGHQLTDHAQRVLAELEAAEAALASSTGRVGGLVRIGVTPSTARALLPEALVRLRETAPDVDVRIEQLSTDEGVAGITSSTLDVAIVGEYGLVPRQLDVTLERRELLVEPVLVAVPVRHPAQGPTVRLAELGQDRWIGAAVDSPALELLLRGCGVAGVQPQVVGHCADDALALTLVAAGMALALVPASAADQHGGPDRRLDGVRLLTPVDPSLRRTVVAVARQSAAGDPAISRLLDALTTAGRRFIDVTPGASRPAPTGIGAEPPRPAPERNGHPAILPPPLSAMDRRPPASTRQTGADLLGRGPAPDLNGRPAGPADLPPAPLPGPADLPGRFSELDRPMPPPPSDIPRRTAAGPADLPGLPPPGVPNRPAAQLPGLPPPSGPGDLPRRGAADLPGGPPPAGPPNRGAADLPGLPPPGGPGDLPRRAAADLPGLPPPGGPGDLPRRAAADLPGLPPPSGPGDLPRRAAAELPGLPPPGGPNRPAADLPGLPPPSGPGAAPTDLPSRRADRRAANGLPGLPPPGAPSDLPSRRAERRGPIDPAAYPPGSGPGDPPTLRGRPAELPEIRPTSEQPTPPPLPPPGEVPRRRPVPGGPGQPGGSLFRSARPEPQDSIPTSSDLGARSLPASDLPTPRPPSDLPRRANSGPPGRRPGGSEGPRGTSPGPSIARRSRAARSSDGPMGTLPPAPDQEVRLSIFEELQSEWFSRRPKGEDALGTLPSDTPWDSPADDGWRAAARLATPTTAGTTPSGLPKRVPQALYVPGTVGSEGKPVNGNGAASRSAQDVRGRLSSYRDGVRRGRHAEKPPADDQDRRPPEH